MLCYPSVERTLELISSFYVQGQMHLVSLNFFKIWENLLFCLLAEQPTLIENKLQLPFLSRCALTFFGGKVYRWEYLNLRCSFKVSGAQMLFHQILSSSWIYWMSPKGITEGQLSCCCSVAPGAESMGHTGSLPLLPKACKQRRNTRRDSKTAP